jgi:hypothetical protein
MGVTGELLGAAVGQSLVFLAFKSEAEVSAADFAGDLVDLLQGFATATFKTSVAVELLPRLVTLVLRAASHDALMGAEFGKLLTVVDEHFVRALPSAQPSHSALHARSQSMNTHRQLFSAPPSPTSCAMGQNASCATSSRLLTAHSGTR